MLLGSHASFVVTPSENAGVALRCRGSVEGSNINDNPGSYYGSDDPVTFRKNREVARP
jgi:hypothetical protein